MRRRDHGTTRRLAKAALPRCLAGSLGFLVAWSLAGCASKRAALPSGFNFSDVRRISVMPFDGPGGKAVTDEFITELVGIGLEVTDAAHPAKVVLKGSVTEYKANNALMVFLGNTSLAASSGQTVTVKNPVMSASAPQGTPEGTVPGVSNAQMASVHAAVGVTARLVDSSSGNTVWSGAFTYESLDIHAALQSVVGTLAGSLGRLLPRTDKRPS